MAHPDAPKVSLNHHFLEMKNNNPLIIGIGELLWDCFGNEKRPGGAPSNVAYHANQLGLESLIVSGVGVDSLGDDLLDAIQSHGLNTAGIHRDPNHPTGTVTVDTADPDHPSYTIHENVAWDHIRLTSQLTDQIAHAGSLCFGTLAQRCETSRASITQAIQAASQAMVVYDINLRPPWLHVDWIEQSMARAHVIKLNADEVVTLSHLLNITMTDHASFATHLIKKYKAKHVFITKAEDGCFAADENDHIEIPGKTIEVADAVGAGDAFTAALIYGLLKRESLDKIATFANDVGSLVASHAGAMPNISSDFESLKKKHLMA